LHTTWQLRKNHWDRENLILAAKLALELQAHFLTFIDSMELVWRASLMSDSDGDPATLMDSGECTGARHRAQFAHVVSQTLEQARQIVYDCLEVCSVVS